MKKGGLFILGHVKLNSDDDLCSQEYPVWISLIDHMKIKAFVDMTSASTIREGAVHLIRLAGLGGLRPNTIVLGFYDDSIPDDQLRTRAFYKKRWRKSAIIPLHTSSVQSDLNLNSSNSTNHQSILHFQCKRFA